MPKRDLEHRVGGGCEARDVDLVDTASKGEQGASRCGADGTGSADYTFAVDEEL